MKLFAPLALAALLPVQVRIPLKPIGQSGGKPITVPGGNRSGVGAKGARIALRPDLGDHLNLPVAKAHERKRVNATRFRRDLQSLSDQIERAGTWLGAERNPSGGLARASSVQVQRDRFPFVARHRGEPQSQRYASYPSEEYQQKNVTDEFWKLTGLRLGRTVLSLSLPDGIWQRRPY